MVRRLASTPGRRAPRALAALSFSLAALAAAAPAHAGKPSGNEAAADVLFNAGRAAMAKLDYREACAKFRESLALDPAVGTMFNLGDCEERRGKLAVAYELFRDVVRKVAPGDERSSIAKKRVADLQPKVAMLTVTLASGAPAGTTVRRDADVLTSSDLGTEEAADAGPHTIVVEAPGRSPHTVTVQVEVGEKKALEVAPNAEGVSDNDGAIRVGAIVTAAGAAVLLAGIVTGGLTVAKKSTADANCPNKACNAAGASAVSAGRTLGALSATAVVLGLAATGTGTIILLVSGGGEKKASAALVPVIGPGGAGMWISGRF